VVFIETKLFFHVICIGISILKKWEEINNFEVQDPEDMTKFLAEDLT
jgi:hypothetical protein